MSENSEQGGKDDFYYFINDDVIECKRDEIETYGCYIKRWINICHGIT